jgi:atypical dual specificity phosphatase
LKADVHWLREQGIDALLSLTERELPLDSEETGGLEVLHLPVIDMTAPQPSQLIQALSFIDRQRAQGRAVAAHCLQGQGRTGTILAAYLVRQGMEPAAAVSHLRQICPGAIEAKEQERALEAFAKRRDWIL